MSSGVFTILKWFRESERAHKEAKSQAHTRMMTASRRCCSLFNAGNSLSLCRHFSWQVNKVECSTEQKEISLVVLQKANNAQGCVFSSFQFRPRRNGILYWGFCYRMKNCFSKKIIATSKWKGFVKDLWGFSPEGQIHLSSAHVRQLGTWLRSTHNCSQTFKFQVSCFLHTCARYGSVCCVTVLACSKKALLIRPAVLTAVLSHSLGIHVKSSSCPVVCRRSKPTKKNLQFMLLANAQLSCSNMFAMISEFELLAFPSLLNEMEIVSTSA